MGILLSFAKCLHSAEPTGQPVEESEEVVIQMKAQHAGKSSGTDFLHSVTHIFTWQLLSSIEIKTMGFAVEQMLLTVPL